MALREYQCRICNETCYLFDDEAAMRAGIGGLNCEGPFPHIWHGGLNCEGPFPHIWQKMPPRVSTVLATSMFMLDEPQLDSLPSIYELDRQLNIEAREEQETALFQQIRRNL